MYQNMPDKVNYTWVAARYTGIQAKHVLSLANSGYCYYLLEKSENNDSWVNVAFRYTLQPIPQHLAEITDGKLIERLERWAKPLEFRMKDYEERNKK